jgi:hypothetical protein
VIGRRRRAPRLSRNARFGDLQETFLVSAVATILLIRSQLWLLDYPQIGGGGLHIAHLLWGGLLMMLAIGALLTYLGRRPRMPAAVLGGASFGLFIDELGKFVTSDNDYFFRPAAALIYVLFLALFFGVRALTRRRPLSSTEYVANALDLAAEAVSHDLDEREKERALAMLASADPDDTVVAPLRRMLGELNALPARGPRAYARWARAVGRGYLSLIARPRFAAAVDWVFAVWAIVGLAPLALFLASLVGTVVGPGAVSSVVGDLSPIAVLGFASSLASAALVGVGVRRLEQGTRLAAYRAFDRALMVSILVTDTSLFYLAQFTAAYRLAIDLALLVTIRYMTRRERALEGAAAHGALTGGSEAVAESPGAAVPEPVPTSQLTPTSEPAPASAAAPPAGRRPPARAPGTSP